MSVYLDACVLVPLFVDEGSSAAVRAFVSAKTGEIVASDFGIAEVGAAISHHVRSKRTTEDVALGVLALFDEWVASETIPAFVASSDIERANGLVRRFDLKLLTPDAIHLAICERMGLALVTLDKRLAEAAEVLGVEVVMPQ